MSTSEGTVVVLGLSRTNAQLLLLGRPIAVKLSEMDPRLPPDLTVLIMGGENDDEMTTNLRAAVGDTGYIGEWSSGD